MDNQHKKIKGYRDLSQEEIDLMNEVKDWAKDIGNLLERLGDSKLSSFSGRSTVDQRWLAIAKTDLQKGFMSLVRSVAKPESF